METNDFRAAPLEVMLNTRCRNKLRPVDDATPVEPADAERVLHEAGWRVPPHVLNRALAHPGSALAPHHGGLTRGALLSWAQWRDFSAGFRRTATTARGLAVAVYRGHAFTPVYHGRRKKANFVAAGHIALDFDTQDARSALETLAADEFAWLFASFAYTTPSHTPERPKSRLVFVFDAPLNDLERYETLYQALLWKFPAADQSTGDALRLFYGSAGCAVWPNWSLFPRAAQDELLAAYAAHLAAQAPAEPLAVLELEGVTGGRYAQAALEGEAARLASPPPGERHLSLVRAGAAIGSLVAASWTGLEEQAAVETLVRAALAGSPGRKYGEAEIRRSIRDGLAYGKASPRSRPSVAFPPLPALLRR